MKMGSTLSRRPTPQGGSVLIIVLWIALGLVAITPYFANSMTFELRAADNRVAMLAADQAIEGAARYVSLGDRCCVRCEAALRSRRCGHVSC